MENYSTRSGFIPRRFVTESLGKTGFPRMMVVSGPASLTGMFSAGGGVVPGGGAPFGGAAMETITGLRMPGCCAYQ